MSIHAQTSGATAPEVTQFEPVDISGLVDPSTGDFNYSLPVMVIPGAPGGAYPLALNYHAGILYDQEASWVGLGWNLQPGSISRIVRGYPDDWNNATIERFEKFTTVYSYSIGINYAGASVGIQWDNHNGVTGVSAGAGAGGFSISASGGRGGLGVGLGYTFANSLNIGVNYGSGGWGASAGYGEKSHFGVSYSSSSGVGVNYSYSSKDGDLLYNTHSSTGVSLNSDGIGFNYSQGFSELTHDGHRGYSQSGSGNVSASSHFNGAYKTSTSGATIPIPIYAVVLELGFHKSKTTKEETASAYGLIHMPKVRGAEDRYEPPFSKDELDVLLPGKSSGKERGVALDVHVQSFDSANLNAEYASTQYDLFSVAAQGVHGLAKPLIENKGWIRPADETLSIPVHDNYRIHPYKSVLEYIGSGYSSFEWDNYFQKDSTWKYYDYWTNPITPGAPNATTIGSNMAFINDAGLFEDQTLSDSSFMAGNYDPRHYFEHAGKIENRSKSIKYFLEPSQKQ